MNVNRTGLYRPKEADHLNNALVAFLSAPPIDKYRKFSKSQMDSLDKVYYSAQEGFHCMVSVRDGLFKSVGLNPGVDKSYSLGGVAYNFIDVPKIDFKS